MKNKELEQQYLTQAIEYITANTPDTIPEGYQAIFMTGAEYGLNLREAELNQG